ncbi:MAG: hypothetical protein R3E32_16590 [Chitinophagales bacterium]
MKKSILLLFFVVSMGNSTIHAQDNSLIETDMIEVSGFFDVKTTDFTFKKVDANNRIIAFTTEDLEYLKTFFENQEGVLRVEGDKLDKTVQVVSLLEKDGQIFFQHREIAEVLNQDGFVTIRLRTRSNSRYLVASHTITNKEDEMTAELISEEKVENCNECGEVQVSKEVLDLLKNMDFGGEMFNMSSDSTNQFKPTTDMQ